MTTRLAWVLAVGILLASISGLSAADKKADRDKRDRQARQVLEEFKDALLARDLDALMKVVDVPWIGHPEGKTKVIRERDELKKLLPKLFPPPDGPEDVKLKVTQQARDTFIAEHRDRLQPDDIEAIKGVLHRDDRVLTVEVSNLEGKKVDTVLVPVGFRKGQAKIVGFVD